MVMRKDKRREKFLRAIIAHQMSTFTSSVKPDEDFLRLIFYIFLSSVAFHSLIIVALTFPKLRVWVTFTSDDIVSVSILWQRGVPQV